MAAQAMLNNSKAVNEIETNFSVQIRKMCKPTPSFRTMNRSYIKRVSLGRSLCVCLCKTNSNRYIPVIQTAQMRRSWHNEQTMHDGSCSCSGSYDCSYHSRINMRTVSHSIIFHKCTVNCYKYPNASHFTGDKIAMRYGDSEGETRGDGAMHRKHRERERPRKRMNKNRNSNGKTNIK